MQRTTRKMAAGLPLLAAASLVAVQDAGAAGTGLPGDRGRPFDGIFPVVAGPPRPREALHLAPAIPLELAVKAARAVSDACPQYRLGVAVTDAEGVAKLIYVPDRSESWHGYSAVRKAYTAVTFGADSSAVMQRTRQEPDVAARVKADPNLQAFSGALLIRSGGKILGAIAVSGAEPGGHDEECARAGMAVIAKALPPDSGTSR